ncbi:MAG: hypothetical protein N5837_08545, partial [Lactobacillus crispatus]|nr:hypothetical protein [Lactobacillus crispatus]
HASTRRQRQMCIRDRVVDDDATTGATYRRNSDPDAATGASTKAAEVKEEKHEEPDTTTGASQH